jgi:hypothetical protein
MSFVYLINKVNLSKIIKSNYSFLNFKLMAILKWNCHLIPDVKFYNFFKDQNQYFKWQLYLVIDDPNPLTINFKSIFIFVIHQMLYFKPDPIVSIENYFILIIFMLFIEMNWL